MTRSRVAAGGISAAAIWNRPSSSLWTAVTGAVARGSSSRIVRPRIQRAEGLLSSPPMNSTVASTSASCEEKRFGWASATAGMHARKPATAIPANILIEPARITPAAPVKPAMLPNLILPPCCALRHSIPEQGRRCVVKSERRIEVPPGIGVGALGTALWIQREPICHRWRVCRTRRPNVGIECGDDDGFGSAGVREPRRPLPGDSAATR